MKDYRKCSITAKLLALLLSVSLLSGCLSDCNARPAMVTSHESTQQEISTEPQSYQISFSFYPDGFNDMPEIQVPDTQEVKEGENIKPPAFTVPDDYVFVGWFKKEVSSMPFGFDEPVHDDIKLVGLFLQSDDTQDSDEDGLQDNLEDIIGTDSNHTDTDGDELSDGLEFLKLNLDPLSRDTNHNQVTDDQEDCDSDGLSNLEELERGCNPILYDTDGDGLSDSDELQTWNTNPRLLDTDGDYVEDGIEVNLGTDPLSPEISFVTEIQGDEINTERPVSIAVRATTDAKGAGTLTVRELSTTDNLALSPSSIGYLAPAYELTTEGSLVQAELSFAYDPAIGSDSEDFDPTIYWYDEESSQLVEVADQHKESGVVTAVVSHFSEYGLFDKSTIDAAAARAEEALNQLRDLVSPEKWAEDKNNDGLPDRLMMLVNEGYISL